MWADTGGLAAWGDGGLAAWGDGGLPPAAATGGLPPAVWQNRVTAGGLTGARATRVLVPECSHAVGADPLVRVIKGVTLPGGFDRIVVAVRSDRLGISDLRKVA